jgi:formate hydrogenlyase transcriptional activator
MPNERDFFSADEPIPLAHIEPLSEPEKLLATYFRSSSVGLSFLDSQLRYLAINNSLAEIHGIPAADHLGKTVRDILGDFADVIEPQLQRVFSTGEPVLNLDVSAIVASRSGSGQWVANYFPIKDHSGKVTRIGLVVVEISAQRELRQSLKDLSGKLRKEMGRLQMLLDISSIMASTLDMHQVFPKVSARIRRVLRHEYAGFELHDAGTGLLIRQAEDFPLRKGILSAVQISPHNSPGGLALRERTPLIFSKQQMQGFEAEITKNLLAEGLRSLCCVPLFRPKGPLGVLVLGSTRVDAFQPEDLTLLNQVAAQFAIALENQKAATEIDDLKQRLSADTKYLVDESRSTAHFPEIIGDSPALKQALDQVATVAPSEATVLLLGETGTGKELFAQALHRLSRRKDGPFIKVNCAAIPTGLLESELFGHEKGAFTGAVSQKVGRMELAHGGTLFLDEVGEIPLELQPKLLRVLQDQEFERLGSNRTIKVDLRLIAATNRDLALSMTHHEFRSDLFYRLSVFPIRVPALRDRRDDIPMLVRHFVRKFAQRMNRNIESIPGETMTALSGWSWPGNVRELENLMERSVIVSEGHALRVPLAELRDDPHGPTAADRSPEPTTDHSLDNAERQHIIRILRETNGVLSGPGGAAHRLGLKRTTLQSKMQRLKITRRDYSNS